MKSKRIIAMAVSAALALSLGGSVLAAGDKVPGMGGHDPSDAERQANGHTTISIVEAKMNPKNASFEVPLYVTMAVIDNAADVVVPDNYGIKNTTTTTDGGFNIGVTAMYFEKLAGSTFNTVADKTAVAANTDIALSIGAAQMPALSTAGKTQVDLAGSDMVGADGKPKPILSADNAAADTTKTFLKLTLVGDVLAATRGNSGTVAQFKVMYTVSALDANNNPIANPYAGDDSYVAGLGDQEPATP